LPIAILPAAALLGGLVNVLGAVGPAVFLLGFLVLFHEFGHFLVAKRLGVPVNRFSIGFGPRLFGLVVGETDYCVSLFPLGGYVSMAKEETGPDGQPVVVDLFTTQSWWKRVVISVAGPGANLVAGYLAMVAVGVVGVTYDDYRAELGPVAPHTVAAQLGFAPHESVRSVDGHPVVTWKNLTDRIQAARGDVSVLVRERTGATHSIVVPKALRDTVLATLSPRVEPVVGGVVVGLPAYPAGLKEGDRILAVNGRPVELWEDLTAVIHVSAGKPVDLRMRRGSRIFDVRVTPTPQQDGERTVGVIGISPPRQATYVVRLTPWEALTNAGPLVWNLTVQTGRGLWMLATRPVQAKDQMGGPLLIMRMSSQQAKKGWGQYLFLMGVISIAIMAFNLLPLPILDGGHVLLALVEGARRRPLAQGFLTAYQRLGLALIGSLLVFILFNDVWREAQRGRAMSRSDRSEQQAGQPAR
jgi:regulator of sigma E protease